MPNRNKRFIALDLKSERDRELFHELATTADLVIENFRPGVTQRLGIDCESCVDSATTSGTARLAGSARPTK
ncbi:MAG: CoA transferase [Mycobacterium sp.]